MAETKLHQLLHVPTGKELVHAYNYFANLIWQIVDLLRGPYMNDPSFRQVVTNWMASEAYRKVRLRPNAVEPSADRL